LLSPPLQPADFPLPPPRGGWCQGYHANSCSLFSHRPVSNLKMPQFLHH
jgi:hypothetical protein